MIELSIAGVSFLVGLVAGFFLFIILTRKVLNDIDREEGQYFPYREVWKYPTK
jgi:hypothetical protein